MANRWWVYQRERFPVLAHGPLIAAFSFSAVSFSLMLRVPGVPGLPTVPAIVTAFVTALFFFLQLRIADEFKDFEEDSRYRPYRPVPRGLVKLWELGLLWAITAAVQLGLALWLEPSLAWLLLVVWVYLALMSKEFFVAEWLKHRALLYMFSHMAIMPLIDFYATACDWWPTGHHPPPGLYWFVAVSYFNGIVIEVGRKIRAPQDEEEGVNTYTHLWGRRNAVVFWLAFLMLTAFCAAVAAWHIDFFWPMVVLLIMLLLLAGWVAARFLKTAAAGSGKRIEHFSGLWTLMMYLGLGAVPVLYKAASSGATQ
jgi:4-hydroxybenzoate polyprenyltransferase